MNKIVYVVTGSEDGILGVYGNKKGAYNKALWYVHQDDVYNYSIDIVDDYSHFGNASIHAVLFNEKERK